MLRINNSVKQSLWKNWGKPSKEEAWAVRQGLKEYPLEKGYKGKNKRTKELEVGSSILIDNNDYSKHIIYKNKPNFIIRKDYIGFSNDSKEIYVSYFQTEETKKEIESYNKMKEENPDYKNKYLLMSYDIIWANLKVLITKKEQNKRSKVIIYTWIVHKVLPHKHNFSSNYEDKLKEYGNYLLGKEVYFRF